MTPVRYLDVCSGYSAFTLASADLGFRCAGYSEIEPFPRAVLEQRHGAVASDWDHRFTPGSNVTPLFGDFTQIEAHHVGPVDLLAGGTPCQAFSVAGKRLGLDDPRGNLTLEFLALARRVRAPWLVWENVPGFLSHDGGRTMGTFLRLLGDLGYGWAYRVLDAQYIRVDRFTGAVPQRRRRLFVVAHLGDAAGPAAVLFERESLRGDPAPRREAGEGIAPPAAYGIDSDCLDRSGEGADGSAAKRSGLGIVEGLSPGLRAKRPNAVAFGGGNRAGAVEQAACLTARGHKCDFEVETFVAQPIAASLTRGAESAGKGGYAGQRQEDDVNLVAHALRADGFDASEDGTGRGTPLVPVCYDTTHITSPGNWSNPQPGAPCHPITRTAHVPLLADPNPAWAVRRLTPTECERLMGVPDGFTAVTYRGKPAADGPRYKALGNSQAVNCMRWIARGLAEVMAAQARQQVSGSRQLLSEQAAA
jgi:DNA (cytosine-5)-methyltransferase 1